MKGLSHLNRREARRQMLQEMRDGMTDAQASEKFGLSESYVRQIRNIHEVESVRPGRLSRVNQLRAVAYLMNTRDSFRRIGEMVGCTHQRIGQIHRDALEAGIELPARDAAVNGEVR